MVLAIVAYFVFTGASPEPKQVDVDVSLPEVSVRFTQSVIPIGAVLYIIAELMILPQVIAEARGDGGPGASSLAEKLH